MGMVTGVSLDAMGSSRLDLSQAFPSTLSRDGNVLAACARSVIKQPIECWPQPWVGRRGLPVCGFLFHPLKTRGMARRKAHALDYSRAARLSVGRARIAGPWRS